MHTLHFLPSQVRVLTALEGVTFTQEIPVSLGLLELDTPVGHSQIQVQRLIPDL